MYFHIKTKNRSSQANSWKLSGISDMANWNADDIQIFQFEPAVVLDIILDENHPELKGVYVQPPQTPLTQKGEFHEEGKPDFSYIGRALVRMKYSQRAAVREVLKWASPISPDTTSFPLINEVVSVVEMNGRLYYDNRINLSNMVNLNSDYSFELYNSDGFGKPLDPEKPDRVEFVGPKNNVTAGDIELRKNFGINGRYFSFNDKIRRLRRYEGDTLFESRFGQSIRFGAYDHTAENDIGDERYTDYHQKKKNPYSERASYTGGGNPMFLIRNRQRQINSVPTDIYGSVVDKWETGNENGIRVPFENDFNSDIHENVNWDGSSLHMTSGLTFTKFNRDWHFAKRHWQDSTEEVKIFSPKGSTRWVYPQPKADVKNPFWGDQTVLMSDRIIIASRGNETLHFSKKRYGIVCDEEYTVDSHEQMVFTTHEKIVFNSPHIYLGEYNQTREPAVLGQSTIDWLYALCEWLEKHQHWYHHIHPQGSDSDGDGQQPTDDSVEPYTQEPVTQHVALLRELKKRLPEICSKRVFLTGGGWAPGRDGVDVNTLFNEKVGKINNTPGGYYVSATGQFSGKMENDSTNGMVEPKADYNGKNPNFIKHPDSMRSNH